MGLLRQIGKLQENTSILLVGDIRIHLISHPLDIHESENIDSPIIPLDIHIHRILDVVCAV